MMQIICPHCEAPGGTLDGPCDVCGKPMIVPLPDSGQKRQFPSGAWRDNSEGKGRFDLLPVAGLMAVAKRFEDGAKKYGDDNWRKGFPMSVFYDSGMRHLLKAMRGDTDEDHLAAAAWNILCAIETRDVLSKKSDNGGLSEVSNTVHFPPTAPGKLVVPFE